MTNEIAERKPVFGGKVGMVNAAALADAMAASAAKDPRGGAIDGANFLNFSGKRGVYEYGQDKKDLDPNEAWLINIGAFEDGWICWKDNRPLATRLYPLGTELPSQDFGEHGPFTRQGDGWYASKSLTCRSIDSGEQAYFKISSVSGVSVFANLQKDVVQRIRSGQAAWPVVTFDKERFTAQGHSNFKPVINVLGWLDDEHVQLLADVFEDEDAELNLEAMFLASAEPAAITNETAAPEKARRRRSAL